MSRGRSNEASARRRRAHIRRLGRRNAFASGRQALRDGPLSITRLTDGAKVTRQAITKHLHALAGAGLVRDRRNGRERLWELQPERLEAAQRSLDQISAHWDAALGRLRAMVEG